MHSRKFILGAAGAGSLAVAGVAAMLLGHVTVAVLIQIVLLAGIATLSFAGVLSQRRTGRQVSRLLRQGVRVEVSHDSSPTATEADLVGTIRLLQAQYVGRLDRAQATFERAAAGLVSCSGRADVVLPAADISYVPAVEAALTAGLTVAVLADGPEAHGWVNDNGWADRVTVIVGADVKQDCA